jgi:beta-phosphoglucomutase-like phosphatase (HAD superfamily)
VASATDRIRIEANLRQAGLPSETWDAVVSGNDVARKKPAPDTFLPAADRRDLTPPECVVIEDSHHGIAAARAAGMRCVAVAQTFPARTLSDADAVRASIGDVTFDDLG